MTTLEQLTTALRNADAAGDVAAARKIADAIRSMQAGGNYYRGPGQPARVTVTGWGEPERPRQIAPDEFAHRFDPAGTPSQIETLGRAAEQGFTFGTSDELRGVAAAGTGAPNIPVLGPLARLAYGGINLALDRGDARERYAAARDEARARLEQGRELYPGTALAGEIGGALATAPFTGGLGVAAKGAGLGARALAGMRAGGAYGLAYGAGTAEGSPVERAPQAALSGAVGAIAGGALPLAARGASIAAEPVRQIARTVRGAIDPEREAVRRVAAGFRRDLVDPASVPGRMAAEQAAGHPVVAADMGGAVTRTVARSAANSSPEARGVIESTLAARQSTQRDRFVSFLSRWQRASVPSTREALQDAARKANAPAYRAAYAAGDRPIVSPELERLLSAPAVVDALRRAAETGKSRAVAEGFGGFRAGVRITPDGRVIFGGRGGAPTWPNLQLWDYTYRGLRDAADRAFRQGANSEGQYLSQLARQLRSELDRVVPQFRQARGTAALFFGAEDALEAGQKFALSRMGNAEARRAIVKLSPAERTLFEEGFLDTIVRRVAEGSPSKNVVDEIFLKSPAAKERIETVLGPQRTAALEAYLRTERIMQMLSRAMGNSTTVQQLAAFGLAGGVGAQYSTGDWSLSRFGMGAVLGGAARQGLAKVDQRVAQRVGELLMSDDPQAVARAFRTIAASPALQNLIRVTESSIARIAGQQAPRPFGGVLPAAAGEENENRGNRPGQ